MRAATADISVETRVKDIRVCINPHFDAVSLWIGSFGGADSPCDISRGVFRAKGGVPLLAGEATR